ncbi:MAG: DUF1080 domain-containing protein [Akkermansiaceae bacterium]|jgi:putative membrane-bound dehydrogenase-like protein|nr:DUF1080 domain-containing protein [Akkermansiaceae bacterium]
MNALSRHLIALLLLLAPAVAEPVKLFDGRSLDGWEVRAGEEKWWTVADGVIRGGSLTEKVPHNTFLATRARHANFDLKLKVRLVKGEGFMNSGIQIRSIRVEGNHEMSGYQVDAGIDWWGKLYDESRRNRVIGEPVDPAAVKAAVRDWEWNEMRILCEGPRIRTWINGVAALDFTEKEKDIPLEGLIGLQCHGGGRFLVEFKDIELTPLPATPGAAVWPKKSPLSPADQKSTFRLPEGFDIELVTSEEQGVVKPVSVAWDHAGRLWTMTAREYPVDANENRAHAEALYAKGGQDELLVIDEPHLPGPHQPRVFASGLAIPLGILPLKDGVLAQYGSEIRIYQDSDGDGKSDSHKVVLEGFGIQDSHLFPHQFERAPGGWIYVAQGLFNDSNVKRPGGLAFANGQESVPFKQCKLAWFQADGSRFENLTAGPNNIWGLGLARDGEVLLQEANDMGIPAAEFIDGAHYQTGSRDKLRPYAPQMPQAFDNEPFGGSGLSGLAIAEDRESAFGLSDGGSRTIYLANPITNRIQTATFHRDADGTPHFKKQADFLTSTDPWFRPVAIHFGPDGALYVVDWYNKIISHNEVPRTHPDRDKSHGRIWRIVDRNKPRQTPPDLTRIDSAGLVALLDHPNARVARMVWQQLGDRGDREVIPALIALLKNTRRPIGERLGALWALEEMRALDPELLVPLAADPVAQVRYEAIRATGLLAMEPSPLLRILQREETHFRVLAASANALRRQPEATPELVAALANRPRIRKGPRGEYESRFLDYLTRWAMETHPEATREALAKGIIRDPDSRSLAILALPPEEGAIALIHEMPKLDRPLTPDEAGLLGGQLGQAQVAAAFGKLLEDPTTSLPLLQALMLLDPASTADPALRESVARGAAALAATGAGANDLVIDLARRFRLAEMAPVIRKGILGNTMPLVDALRALNEIGMPDADLCRSHLDATNPALAAAAMSGFAAGGGTDAVKEIAARWENLAAPLRQLALDGMLSKRETASEFVRMAAEGSFKDFGGAALEKARKLLGPEDPGLAALMASLKGVLAPVIRLHGGAQDRVRTDVRLEGPFTIEAWIKLDPGISNADNLLGRKGGADINFHDGKLRLYAGGKDRIVASRAIEPGVWSHVAVIRDAAGNLSLFIDGSRDSSGSEPFTEVMDGLQLGESHPAEGSAASYDELRIWNMAREEKDLLATWRTRLGNEDHPPGLVKRFAADTPGLKLEGGAAIDWQTDPPSLITPAEAAAAREKYDRFRTWAVGAGDAARGKALATASCMICHRIKDEGIAIGPDLSGAGAMGVDGLLRNILYPNDQLESGYYRHDVTLKDGSLLSGFLVSEDADRLILRPLGADERVIPRDEIASHDVSRRTLMPEGLIDAHTPQQVADLFTYLLSLK